ncbi:MAG: hypothetical protein AAB581_00490 [Patescibacteria group bacterium]
MKQKDDFKYLPSEEHEEFYDLALCSALQYLEFPIVAINRDPKEHPRVGFVFKKSEKLSNAVSQFWSGALSVEPKGFWNARRELKSRIHTTR